MMDRLTNENCNPCKDCNSGSNDGGIPRCISFSNGKQIKNECKEKQRYNRLSELGDKLENGTLVEVIRCKDCRYAAICDDCIDCGVDGLIHSNEHFCSNAVPKEQL